MKRLLALIVLGAVALEPSLEAAQLKKLKKVMSREGSEQRKEKREQRTRARIEELAAELYETDEEFREAVDQQHGNNLKKHMRRAFEVNTSQPSSPVVIREDRLRLHGRDTLYDNLMIQAYVNRLGQSLVPEGTLTYFSFRLINDPVPFAETLSTGTIYLSTGLVASLENEAQLAYVLAHEMAHVYLDHWKDWAKLELATEEYMERQERRQRWKILLAGGLGAAVGKQIDGDSGMMAGAFVGAAAVALTQPRVEVDWDTAQEDEADRLAFDALRELSYDTQEVPIVLAKLLDTAVQDRRVGLGFIGNPARLRERLAQAERLLVETSFATAATGSGSLLIDTHRYRQLMAELWRDNGIQALLFDMFRTAENNLRQAVEVRSNDPTALYYYGKLLSRVGRTEDELAQAREYFRRAAEHDTRNWNFGAHLHYAMTLLSETADPATVQMAAEQLQAYIESYSNYWVRQYAIRQLPSHLDTLYDFMSMSGQAGWSPDLPEAPPDYLFADWEEGARKVE